MYVLSNSVVAICLIIWIILKDFENASLILNHIFAQRLRMTEINFIAYQSLTMFLDFNRKFMAVNLIIGVEITAFIKQG